MSGQPYPQTDRELLRRIERDGGRAGYKQLVRELGMGDGRERRLLLEQLTRMAGRGALVKVDRESWALPQAGTERAKNEVTVGGLRSVSGGLRSVSQDARGAADGGRRGFRAQARERQTERALRNRDDLIAGKLSLHRDGYGFVRPNGAANNGGRGAEGKDADIFIPPPALNGAMQGDQVLVDPGPLERDGRRAGRVLRILTRRNPTVVGIFHVAGARGQRYDPRSDDPRMRGSYVTPLDERVGRVVLIPDDADLPAAAITPHRTLGEDAVHALEAAEHRWDGTLDDLNGLAVDVEITQYPTDHSPAQGRVIEVLGDPDAFGVDVEIVIRKHHLPHVFPADVLAEAQDAAQRNVGSLDEEELRERRDFRGEPIITIDGETAKDFDDAVLVRELGDGTFELQVHIADVAEYVLDGSALDLEARLRGNSVYFPDRAIPMLPQELSSGECSLRPDEDRLVLSCIARIDSDGNVLGYEVCEGMIRSARRMTYTKVQKILNGDAELREEYAPFVLDFERMLDLAKRLNAKRVRRGSIDFDLPEAVIEFDERGAMRGVVRSERAWANRLIEEFMLCANECVARWVEASGVPGIYRIHEQPDPKRIADFEEQAAGFGYTLGVGPLPVQTFITKGDRRETQRRQERGKTTHGTKAHEVVGSIDISPKLYQKLTAKIAGTPEERILSYLLLRSLKQAKYSAENEGHFALAAPSYTHFTSPIRRYPDLIVHRVVKTLLREGVSPLGEAEETVSQSARNLAEIERGNKKQAAGNSRRSRSREADIIGPYEFSELAAIAQETSETERRAADAERELIEQKKLRFMADRVGEDFDAIILSVTKYGFFVELHDLFVEGLVPIHTLPGDRFVYRESERDIRGASTGLRYRPGMPVRVLLDRIDHENRRLQFAVLQEDNVLAEGGQDAAAPAGTRPWTPRASKGKTKSRGLVARTDSQPLSPDRGGKPKRKSAGKTKLSGKKGKGKRR